MKIESLVDWGLIDFDQAVRADCLSKAEMTFRSVDLNPSDPVHVYFFLIGAFELLERTVSVSDALQPRRPEMVGDFNHAINAVLSAFCRVLNFIDLVPDYNEDAVNGCIVHMECDFSPRAGSVRDLELAVFASRLEYLSTLTSLELEVEKTRQLQTYKEFSSATIEAMALRAFCVYYGAQHVFYMATTNTKGDKQQSILRRSFRRLLWDYDLYYQFFLARRGNDIGEQVFLSAYTPRSLRELLEINVPSDLLLDGGA